MSAWRTLVSLTAAVAVAAGCSSGGSEQAATTSEGAVTSAAPSTTVAPTSSIPASDGRLAAGTYRAAGPTGVEFTVTLPEDWAVRSGTTFDKAANTTSELGFSAPGPVDAIYADACGAGAALSEVGPTTEDLASALLSQPGPVATGPTETTLGGRPALRVDLAIPEDLNLDNCRTEGAGLQIWLNPPDDYFALAPGRTASVYILAVDGTRQVVTTIQGPTTSAADLAELQDVLDSLSIGK